MRARTILAAAVAAAAMASPATAAYDATAIEIAEHAAVTGVTTSIAPPTTTIAVAAYPTVTQAVAKGLPSAYGTVTVGYSCSAATTGIAFVTITECSIATSAGAYENNPVPGILNVATTAGTKNLPGRTIRVCVQALVDPQVGASFYTPRSCGISI